MNYIIMNYILLDENEVTEPNSANKLLLRHFN